MPQIDINYSQDLKLDLAEICKIVNDTIEEFDGPGRDCKIRTNPAFYSNQPSIFINIGLLEKPHRDETFQKTLINLILEKTKPFISNASLAVNIYFLNTGYISEKIEQLTHHHL